MWISRSRSDPLGEFPLASWLLYCFSDGVTPADPASTDVPVDASSLGSVDDEELIVERRYSAVPCCCLIVTDDDESDFGPLCSKGEEDVSTRTETSDKRSGTIGLPNKSEHV